MKRLLGWTLLLVFVGLPVLLLASCTYTSFSPHLRLDPLTSLLMDAPRDAERHWRTVEVTLTQDYLEVGQDEAAVIERLQAGGFTLFADYTTDIGPPDRFPDDDMLQASIDQMHRQSRVYFNELGITQIFERGGRARVGCGENIFVQIGVAYGVLTKASGYSRWTCL